jgi:membrane protein DedA with SNARE-associated domain/rhodanese-related sulfurtransferase
MHEITRMLIEHGAAVVFLTVFIEQMGVPIPAAPFLLVAGSLAATGEFPWLGGFWTIVLACLLADSFWFQLGRHRGGQVLGLVCRLSMEPDSCVRKTHNIFTRYGLGAVLVAKFVPGLSMVAPPLAGMSGVSFVRFLLADTAGSIFYAGTFLLLGYGFSGQIQEIIAALDSVGRGALLLLLGGLLVYVGFKYWQRQKILRELRMARITVAELREKQAAGEALVILDLRSHVERKHDPACIPGAIALGLDELDHRHHEIPRDREVVIYCSCPNEISSARMANQLRSRGITRVRPLLGGIAAWRELEVEASPA